MFRWLGGFISQRAPWILLAWMAVIALAAGAVLGGFGQGGLFDRLSTSLGYTSGSQSHQVSELLAGKDNEEKITLLVTGLDPVAEAARLEPNLQQTASALKDVAGIRQILLPDPQRAPYLYADNNSGFAVIVQGQKIEAKQAQEVVQRGLVKDFPQVHVQAVSKQVIGDEITELSRSDLEKGEAVSLPIALILLILIFGGITAAGMPFAGALASIVLGLAGVWTLTLITDVDSFVLNVITIIGLALSIDYSLLIVSRFREEYAPKSATQEQNLAQAVENTVASAGRTVFFSALTIAFSIAALLVFPTNTLRMISFGGAIVTLVAVLVAITLVPALLMLLGKWLARPSLLAKIPILNKVAGGLGDKGTESGIFSALARRVQRHPILTMLAVFALMLVMAAPVLALKSRTDLVAYLPADSATRTAYLELQSHYPALAEPAAVVITGRDAQQVEQLKTKITALADVDSVIVQPVAEHPGLTQLDIHAVNNERVTDRTLDLVEELRQLDAELLVGGPAAFQADFESSLKDHAPLALGLLSLAVFVLLFLMTGSLMVPLKALLLNFLSLAASLGATYWLFEHGLFGLPKVDGLETFIVACVMAFGFGLSMDYEVFLVARIKEYWDAGKSNDDAVAIGLQKSGRIITSAAAIIVAVFFGFVSGEMLPIKQIGVALAIMIITDATLVRMLLVPATMTVLGKWNWWAPGSLNRLYKRFQIRH